MTPEEREKAREKERYRAARYYAENPEKVRESIARWRAEILRRYAGATHAIGRKILRRCASAPRAAEPENSRPNRSGFH